MIILKHLTIERFRLLQSVNLHFPQRGSILVQGPNEAGKSALIESIYFALYGEPLATGRSKRPLDDLVLYGASNAYVALTLSIGATELSIARTIERGQGQQAQLQVRRLGLPDETPITDLADANQRIIAEMGQLNGEALRNSSLIEQKGLTRLETIPGVERETTVRKLLGLESLLALTEEFQVGPEDERLLKDCTEHLHLAEIQARIPQVSAQLTQIETALDVVVVCESLDNIAQQEQEITELEVTVEDIQQRRGELKLRLSRVQQLKRADGTLATIISAYDDIDEARTTLPELEREIADLELREREDLPKLEKRVNDLSELTRSFGTLQRMSNDLLTAVENIKELEQEVRRFREHQEDLRSLNDQVAHARNRLNAAQQALHDIEERRRVGRPLLESRLQRLRDISDSLNSLRQLEEQYTRRVSSKSLAEENSTLSQKVQLDLQESEQELTLVEQEARQAQMRANTVERTWRQLSLRRQLEEWQRLKNIFQGLEQAEVHVNLARQQHFKLDQEAQMARTKVAQYNLYFGLIAVLVVVCIAVLLFVPIDGLKIASVLVLIVSVATAGLLFQQFVKARKSERDLRQRLQEASSRVSMMVVARETAARTTGSLDILRQAENELRSLGSSVPSSMEEAQQWLMSIQEQGDLGEAQNQMKERLEQANAARNQVNVTMEAVANLRKERARLEEERKRERWDSLESDLYENQAAIERMQQEVTLLAGQESFPLPSITARLQNSPIASNSSFMSGAMLPVMDQEDLADMPVLEDLVESTIKATEHEMAVLDSKLAAIDDLASQVKVHQEAFDVLILRQNSMEERGARFQESNPERQIEYAREQQAAMRSALQTLQDSLRQRVKPLGVIFGQAAISNAENVARKQLEELNFTLGNKVVLQERHEHFTIVLRERQESLTELYKQLAKFSNSLGSWIVPLNPFVEALVRLRNRCQQELTDANEPGILQELDDLQKKEDASHTKSELCNQEISNAQEEITQMLTQHGCPTPASYARTDLEVVWGVLSDYQAQDRQRLEEEHVTLETELEGLEKQELKLSQQLGVKNGPLSLEAAQKRMEQQERSYQTKKRGNQLVKAVDERLLRKMLPRTEYYMQQVLPLLTGGRYHDVQITTEPEEGSFSGGSCQIQVWDSAAGDYIPTSTLSGGAADQLSLALRLAFAIASLPRELNSSPGFVLLDEPLSSFDRGRGRALVDVVTGDILSQHFEQIILVSHSSTFDPAMFPYHIYMDNGLVVESNLPVVPSFPMVNAEDTVETPIPVTVGGMLASTEDA